MRTTLFHAASTTTSSNDHIQSPMRPARPATRLATGEREEGGGGTGGRGGGRPCFTRPARPSSHDPVTHAASTTSRPPRKRGEGEGGGRGMITTLSHAASTVTTSTVTRRGRGMRGEEEGGGRSPATHAAGGEGGGENDLVSRGQHSHDIHETSTTSHERGERGGGRGGKVSSHRRSTGGGMITTLFHAASTTTSSHPPQRVRWGKGEGRRGGDNDLVCQYDLCKGEKGARGGMITTLFHATSVTTSSHRPRNG